MAEFCTLTGPSSAVSKANNYRLELALKYPFCFLCDGVGLPWYLRFLKWSLKKANVYIYILFIYMCVCVSNLENPRFTEWTSTNLERPPRLPHVCTKMIYGKLGGCRLQEKLQIYLAPERMLFFLFDQASSLQDSELSEEVLLEEVLCKSLFPHRQHGQPACWPEPLHSHSTASAPALRAYKPKCYGACQLSGPLQARTFARKNVR